MAASVFKWAVRSAIAVCLTTLALFVYAIIMEVFFDECGLTVEHSRQKAIRHLVSKNLDPKGLIGPVESYGTCRYDFIYQGPPDPFAIMIYSDWIHGVDISWGSIYDVCGPWYDPPHNKTLQTDESAVEAILCSAAHPTDPAFEQ